MKLGSVSVLSTKEYYIINAFVSHEVSENQIALQHRRGILLISDANLIASIPCLEERIGKTVLLEEIEGIFKTKGESYLHFLIENKIIKKRILPNFKVKKINFFSNFEEITMLLDKSYAGRYNYISYKEPIKLFQSIENSENEIFLIFLNPYNRQLAHNLRNAFKRKDSSLSIFSYIYSGRLYIESLYSPSWKNPCHLCQFTHIESELRYGAVHGVTYQQIIDYLYTENENFSISTPIDFSDSINIAAQLVNRVNLLLALSNSGYLNIEEFTKGIVMDIDSKKVQSDTTFHWELCDCYD